MASTIIWPSTLPQSPLAQTTGGSFAPNRIEFPTDAGDPQQRQRYPTGRIMRSGTWMFTMEQNDTFVNFYWRICNSGTFSFWLRDWVMHDYTLWKWTGDAPTFAEESARFVKYDLTFSRRRP